MTEDALAATLATIRERTTPDPDERERLETVTAQLIERAEAAVAELPAPANEADVVRVGSTARGTWLPGDRDVDLFVRFPTALDRDELEQYGLRVGHEVLPDGREEYAEHPYVVGTHDGFDVDCVPCFDVRDATAIRSAVDRTPFHTAYLEARLDESTAADVRVCKRFLTAIGAYGSDLRTEGFSGYLTELLVVEHGSARALFEAVADWEPPVRLDPEDHGTETFDDPLVVIDPTDPTRNVAAVCSAANVARFQHHARRLLADPDPARFESRSVESFSPADVRRHVHQRGTAPVAVVFDAPNIVDDQLFPQLRRSLAGVEQGLRDREFRVLRSAVFTAESGDTTAVDQTADGAEETAATTEPDARRVALFFELTHTRLPAVERHEGPPVGVRSHAEGFAEAYADRDCYGPFLDGNRYVVERERETRDAVAYLDSDRLFDVALGAQIEDRLAAGYEVYQPEAIPELAETFGTDLGRYFDPRV